MHPIQDSGREESEATFQVPSPGAPGNVTCMALSAHFLIAGTAAGMLLYYQCQDKALLNEFKHEGGAIVKVFPQPYGTRYAASCTMRAGFHKHSHANGMQSMIVPSYSKCKHVAYCKMEFDNRASQYCIIVIRKSVLKPGWAHMGAHAFVAVSQHCNIC